MIEKEKNRFGRFEQEGSLVWIYYGEDTKICLYPIDIEQLEKALDFQRKYVQNTIPIKNTISQIQEWMADYDEGLIKMDELNRRVNNYKRGFL